jgi:hypothetical protein
MPVMQISPGDHNATPITSGRAQAIHGNVVGAIAGAEAAATGARGHRNCLLRTRPGHNTQVPCRAGTGPRRHPVASGPHLPPLHVLIMPHEPIPDAT